MIVYRIGRTKFAKDLSGEGARLFGGRWNQKGTACLYTSQSRALAVLEYTVNVNQDDIPRALSITTLQVPDDMFFRLSQEELPGDWAQSPAPTSTKKFGTVLLQQADHLTIGVPSAVLPTEYNYLINPIHPNIVGVSILDIQDFIYDIRIKTT